MHADLPAHRRRAGRRQDTRQRQRPQHRPHEHLWPQTLRPQGHRRPLRPPPPPRAPRASDERRRPGAGPPIRHSAHSPRRRPGRRLRSRFAGPEPPLQLPCHPPHCHCHTIMPRRHPPPSQLDARYIRSTGIVRYSWCMTPLPGELPHNCLVPTCPILPGLRCLSTAVLLSSPHPFHADRPLCSSLPAQSCDSLPCPRSAPQRPHLCTARLSSVKLCKLDTYKSRLRRLNPPLHACGPARPPINAAICWARTRAWRPCVCCTSRLRTSRASRCSWGCARSRCPPAPPAPPPPLSLLTSCGAPRAAVLCRCSACMLAGECLSREGLEVHDLGCAAGALML